VDGTYLPLPGLEIAPIAAGVGAGYGVVIYAHNHLGQGEDTRVLDTATVLAIVNGNGPSPVPLVPGALPALPRWKALNGDAYLGYGGFAADYNNLSVRLHDCSGTYKLAQDTYCCQRLGHGIGPVGHDPIGPTPLWDTCFWPNPTCLSARLCSPKAYMPQMRSEIIRESGAARTLSSYLST